jgi:uncharacterized membrane protein
MPGRKTSSRTSRARAGAALLTVGSVLMLGNVSWIAVRLAQLLASFGVDTLGLPVAASQTLLKLFRTIAFDPSALFSFGFGILVLFFALVGILSGLMLLRRRTVETA